MLAQNPAVIAANWKWQKPNNASLPAHCSFSSSLSPKPLRFAVLGAGFAGLSVAWNLLLHGPKDSHLCVDIYDETGVGGGASGIAGGLLHPYSPKVKLLWKGAECWEESLNLLKIAEQAYLKLVKQGKDDVLEDGESVIIRGILRPAVNSKYMNIMSESSSMRMLQKKLIPNISVPLNAAYYMPDALNVNAQSYLKGLYLACENLASGISTFGNLNRELNFHQKSVEYLRELAGDYDAVIICLGARAAFLPEVSEKLPLRACRGVIAQMQLGDDAKEEYPQCGPSILSDAWLAVHGARHMDLGSTWDWESKNYSRDVTADEAFEATERLLTKASSVYPAIENWTITGTVGGLRGMPPLTANGSLPLLGRVNEYTDGSHCCKYWLFTGLGARGLLYHAWLGKLLAKAVLSCSEDLLPPEVTSWKHKLHL